MVLLYYFHAPRKYHNIIIRQRVTPSLVRAPKCSWEIRREFSGPPAALLDRKTRVQPGRITKTENRWRRIGRGSVGNFKLRLETATADGETRCFRVVRPDFPRFVFPSRWHITWATIVFPDLITANMVWRSGSYLRFRRGRLRLAGPLHQRFVQHVQENSHKCKTGFFHFKKQIAIISFARFNYTFARHLLFV